MLIFDFLTIGNKLYELRKKTGMTQLEIATAAEISERTYADIERGSVNMRIETFLKICSVLQITPNEILTENIPISSFSQHELMTRLENCSIKEKETALHLLSVYLDSIEK